MPCVKSIQIQWHYTLSPKRHPRVSSDQRARIKPSTSLDLLPFKKKKKKKQNFEKKPKSIKAGKKGKSILVVSQKILEISYISIRKDILNQKERLWCTHTPTLTEILIGGWGCDSVVKCLPCTAHRRSRFDS